MHTELKYKREFSEPPPLPPTPHFDLASIAAAKPVQRLRWPQRLRYSRVVLRPRGLLRPGTAVLAGILVMGVGIATMARLNEQINVALAGQQTSETVAGQQTSETVDATADAAPEVEMESTPVSLPNDLPLAGNDMRRHRGRRHLRVPREMFGPPMFVW